MGWLVGYTLASMAASFIVVKLLDYIFAETTSGLVGVARCGLFVATWTAVTAQAGMHGFSKKVRQLKQGLIKHILP